MTEENNALIPLDQLGSNDMVKNDTLFKEMIKSGDYLSRLQLNTDNSEICKRGEFPRNHFAVVRDQEHTDIGETVDVLVVSWRPKALDMRGENVVAEHDPDCENFKSIMETSFQKDSQCMYGPEYLVYLPNQKEFLTFFLGSKSARREAPKLQSFIGKAATLKPKMCENKKKQIWHIPTAVPCSTPFEIPSIEELKVVVSKFENPHKSDVELAEESDEEGRAR